MPRIPTSGAIQATSNVTTPVGLPGAGLGVVAQLAERASIAAFAVEQARVAAQREIDLSRSLSAFTKGMDDLQIQADAQTDPEVMRAGWYEGSQRLMEQVGEVLTDPLTKQEFTQRAEAFHEQRRLGIEKGALNLTVSAGQAQTQQRLQELALQAANASNDLEREEAFTEMGKTVSGAALFYTPEQLGNLSRASFGMVESAEIAKGATALQNARSIAEANAIGERTLGVINSATHTDADTLEKNRGALAADLRITKDRLETQGKAFNARLQEEANDRWVKRLYGATPDTLPSVREILDDPGLTATSREHFAGLLARIAKGESINATDPAVANAVWRKIHDPNDPNPITNTAQLVPYAGNGLGTEDLEKFRADILANQGIVSKQQNSSFAAFLKSAEAQITRATAMIPARPEEAEKFYQFRYMAQQEWERAKKEGKDPIATLLDPQSTEYLGNKIGPYKVSNAERMDAMKRAMTTSKKDEPPASGIPAGSRKTGQTSNGRQVWIAPDGTMWVE